MSLAAGTKLGLYEILSPIGQGGMGEVYRAKDTTLGREVAIKILPVSVSSNSERLQRFEREAKTVAKLNHPNIVTVYGIHDEDGQRFIAMELVEGETLDRIITSSGMPLAKIFDIAIPLADALAAAHDKGIIHRDLKPGNVMVTKEGRVKVLDFGLAKLRAAGPGGSSPDDVTMSAPLTGRGVVIGTVPYMSPEQLQGEPLDHRTDLFSLGIMLYEMAAGQRPFKGKTSATITSSILRDTPRPLHELNGALPRHLGRIIEHCLEKDAEQRFQLAKDVRNELRALRKELDSGSDYSESASTPATFAVPPTATPSTTSSGSSMSAPTRRGEFWIGVGVIGIILIAGFWFMRSGNNSGTSPFIGTKRGVNSYAIDSLAVLPLENLSGDSDQEYFADGMTEALISNLARIKALKVISRTSAMRYKGTDKSLPQIARELNVSGIVEGSVILSGDRVRVTAQLIHAASDTHLWAESYTRHLRDILSLQNDLARAIAREIEVALTPEEQTRFARAFTVNPQAYHDYIMGRYHWNKFNEQDFKKALDYFQQAIEHDPTYAAAYAGLADSYGILANTGSLAPQEAFAKAKSFAQKSLELDETIAEAHSSLGGILITHDWNWTAAEEEFQRAIQLQPGNATAHHWYAVLVLTSLGRFNDAHAEMERAKELDPLSLLVHNAVGWIYYFEREYDKAIDVATETLEMQSAFSSAHELLGAIYTQKGMYDTAIAAYQEAMALSSRHPSLLASLGHAYALAGRTELALALLEELTERSKETYVPAFSMAVLYLGLGDNNRVFEWLERAYVERSNMLTRLNLLPAFDSLHGDPRFDGLLHRIGFPSDPPGPVVEPWKREQICLAVLPFKNLSNDPDTDYLSNEIPASIIDKMSRLSDLSVISRSGAFRFDSTKEDASSFGQSLGASVVLTGQLNVRGSSLTIRAELVDVATNQQLWSDRYPRELTDIMAVEADITQNISEALRLQLTQEERTKLAKDDTKDADAYRALLEGRFWFQKFTVVGWRRALHHFQNAVRIDPRYAVAHAELSKAYSALGIWFGDMPPDEAAPKAQQAAATAIALEDTLGEAHGALALNRFFYDWDWSGAEEEFLRSISLAPESGEVHLQYGILLRVTGRLREAEEVIKVAQRLDPTFPMGFAELGETYTYMGRYQEGIEQCEKALELDPQFPPAHKTLGNLFLAKGMYDEAISHFEKNSSLRNRKTNDLGYLGSAYALAGERAKALAILNELRSIASKGRGQVAAAKVHACLGNVDAAFASLEQAYRQRGTGLLWLKSELQFDPLRGDPRFDELLRRVGFEPESQSNFTVQHRKTMLAVLPFANLRIRAEIT